jgi:WD40 repeat protein
LDHAAAASPTLPALPSLTCLPSTPATRSEDTKLRLWDVESGQLLRTFTQHRDAVTCCCWMPDSRRFLSAGPDKAIFMFDIDGNELQRWRRQHRVQVRAVPSGRRPAHCAVQAAVPAGGRRGWKRDRAACRGL